MSTAFYHLFVLWSSHFFLSEVRLMNFVFGPSSEHLRRVWSKVSPFMQIHVCCSVAKLRPTLGDPMDCSIPGFPVLPYPLKFAQTHVHWVGDTTHHLIRGWHLLLPSLFPMFSKKSQPFTSGGQSIGASASASVFPMSIESWFPLGLTGLISLQSMGQESFPAP